MQAEIDALYANYTWDMVPLPTGKKPIGRKWVYKVKLKADGTLDRCKARLVAKGFNQKFGVDYKETFSPVVKMGIVRTLPTVAASKLRPLFQLDVINAFLHGYLLNASSEIKLQAFSDADWASCPDSKRSVTGYLLLFGKSPITWKSKKHPTVSRSSSEAEYRAMGSSASEITWIIRLLADFGITDLKPVTLHCDNQSALYIAKNPVFHERTKHIELDCHFTIDKVLEGLIQLTYLPTRSQLANILTKVSPSPQFNQLLSKLGMCHAPIPNLREANELDAKTAKSANTVVMSCHVPSQTRSCGLSMSEIGGHATALASACHADERFDPLLYSFEADADQKRWATFEDRIAGVPEQVLSGDFVSVCVSSFFLRQIEGVSEGSTPSPEQMDTETESTRRELTKDPKRKARRSNDLGWKYAFYPMLEVNKDVVKCILCGNSNHGGINQFKQHLIGGYPDIRNFFNRSLKWENQHRLKVVKIIDDRWNIQMGKSLHGASLFLNLGRCFDLLEKDPDFASRIREDFNDVLEKMVRDRDTRNKIIDWWDSYGGRAIELQAFARRIVGLCASSSGCERNWSTFELKRRELGKKFDPLVFEDLEWANEWVGIDDSSTQDQIDEEDEDEDNIHFDDEEVEDDYGVPPEENTQGGDGYGDGDDFEMDG
ncbi:hypothetical protein AgCh_035348 [Apium graveolens]